jgi:hypothetical protein
MTPTDVLDDLISRLEPEDVPVEYIVMARITDFQGRERVVRGAELEDFIQNPELHQIAEARVILNVKKMRKAILGEVNYVYDEVNRLFNLRKNGDMDGDMDGDDE